jgi:hypothetical protein
MTELYINYVLVIDVKKSFLLNFYTRTTPIKLTGILLKVALNTIALTLVIYNSVIESKSF